MYNTSIVWQRECWNWSDFPVAMKTLVTVWNVENSKLLLYKWLGVIVICREEKCQPFTKSSTHLQRASLAWVFFSCSQSVCLWQGKRSSGQLHLIMVLLIVMTVLLIVRWLPSKIIIYMYMYTIHFMMLLKVSFLRSISQKPTAGNFSG